MKKAREAFIENEFSHSKLSTLYTIATNVERLDRISKLNKLHSRKDDWCVFKWGKVFWFKFCHFSLESWKVGFGKMSFCLNRSRSRLENKENVEILKFHLAETKSFILCNYLTQVFLHFLFSNSKANSSSYNNEGKVRLGWEALWRRV